MCLIQPLRHPNNSSGSSAKPLLRQPVLVRGGQWKGNCSQSNAGVPSSRGWCACAGSSVFQVEAPGLKMASFGIGAGGCSLQHRSRPQIYNLPSRADAPWNSQIAASNVGMTLRPSAGKKHLSTAASPHVPGFSADMLHLSSLQHSTCLPMHVNLRRVGALLHADCSCRLSTSRTSCRYVQVAATCWMAAMHTHVPCQRRKGQQHTPEQWLPARRQPWAHLAAWVSVKTNNIGALGCPAQLAWGQAPPASP